MSSLIAHSLTGLLISKKVLFPSRKENILWTLSLIISANLPDIDYIYWFLDKKLIRPRITHSLIFSLFFPTLIILILIGFKKLNLASLIAILLAGISHIFCDLMVGRYLPICWPFSSKLFSFYLQVLPPIAGRSLTDYLFYRNLLIELGIFLPLFLIISRPKISSIFKILNLIIFSFFLILGLSLYR